MKACDQSRLFVRSGLRRYNDIHVGIGEKVEHQLVSPDYWRLPQTFPKRRPGGWHPAAFGTTGVWVESHQLETSSSVSVHPNN
jgi:hypothetical protein